ncbi:unnamed protein product [Rhizoctonia solani]|uniref:Uncharacterized protein n=1 Tax=Rhizoctonia solani TaxID=456999 RepID=A0A8H3E8N9_9AGAM|nr:unnamed protein product [Rhizoctonia solani]
MESMFGKFPLANRPKMTRRKRKNLNLAPGAPTNGTRRGGNSPTTEPTNNPVDTMPSRSLASHAEPSQGSGPHRRAKGIHQSRKLKRGGNHYSWIPANDPLSSPTTEEMLPVTPRSDMSSTFSVSPSPRPSFGRPESPIYERRNAVSAGPHNTHFGFLSGTGFNGFAPASARLIPTHTWPMSTVEETQRFPEPALGGLVQTQSEGALDPHNQALLSQPTPSPGYNLPGFGTPQIVAAYDPNQHLNPTNYATSNYQPIHSFQSSSSRTDLPFLAEQTFTWQDAPIYASGTMSEYPSVNPNDNFSFGLTSTTAGLPDIPYTTHNGSYFSVGGISQAHFLGIPNTYASPPMPGLSDENHLQSLSSDTRRPSLANLAFPHTHSTRSMNQ